MSKPLDPRLVRRSAAVRTQLVWSAALGVLTALLVIAVSWLVAEVVSRRFDGRPVLAFPVAIAVAYLVRALIAWGHGVISERASAKVKRDLRDEVVADLLNPRRLGPRPESSRLITLLGPGMDAFDGYIGRFLPQLALALIVPAAVVAVVAWVDPLSALIIVLTLPLIGVFMALIGLLTRDRVQRRWAAMERLGRHFADVLDGLVVLKIFGRRQEQGLREVGHKHRAESMAALRLAFLSSLVLELVSTISVALVAVAVGLRVVEGHLDLRDAMVVLLLAPEAYLPVRRVGMMFHDSAEGAEATAELLDVLDHAEHTGRATPPSEPAVIEVTGLEVGHLGRERPALQVDRLRIDPGEFLAITGPSGSGKSTFLSTLLGFIAPDRGEIKVGNVALSDLDIDRWRAQIAWVPQVPGIIAGTVADNVRLGDTSAQPTAVYAALRDAGLGEMDPERGLREGAADLSAGERRRLAFARALLRVRHRGAWLLLLDEPTAGLDAQMEAAMVATITGLGVTVVAVAHRPETVAAADRVVEILAAEVSA